MVTVKWWVLNILPISSWRYLIWLQQAQSNCRLKFFPQIFPSKFTNRRSMYCDWVDFFLRGSRIIQIYLFYTPPWIPHVVFLYNEIFSHSSNPVSKWILWILFGFFFLAYHGKYAYPKIFRAIQFVSCAVNLFMYEFCKMQTIRLKHVATSP